MLRCDKREQDLLSGLTSYWSAPNTKRDTHPDAHTDTHTPQHQERAESAPATSHVHTSPTETPGMMPHHPSHEEVVATQEPHCRGQGRRTHRNMPSHTPIH